jgi:hypothetical protein
MLIGNWVAGPIVDRNASTLGATVSHDWTTIWLWPAAMAAVVIVLFALLFRERRGQPAAAPAP